MARSFSNAKLFSSFFVEISNVVSRRGYAATSSQGFVSSGIRGGAGRSAAAAKEEMAGRAKEKVSWVPDPLTSCYRPENSAKEIDVAELRAMLLKKN
ncbi:poly polymerase 2-like [Hibiscus syriacus]|uniref:Poly polymerase 2-like n=1 Tax=Hibiscus syriacus TaxID=106335 RepID=A0A6A2XLM3_HIBSY|nr:poly polymerase 2-like [Hibiscus syriacus]